VLGSISILIPVYNESRYIEQCLTTVLSNDFEDLEYEILVIDGQSSDDTVQIVETFVQRDPHIRLIQNTHKTVPYALNLGIEQSIGEYIIRIDAHAAYPKNYFRTLVSWHQALPDADNVGCACQTEVLRRTPISTAIKTVLSDRFGVGNSLFRTGVNKLTSVDTVPFGCYKRSVFERFGKFDIRLTRNQDIEFNKRILNNGGKIYLIPELACTYYARDTLSAFIQNRFNTGKWIIQTAYLTKSFNSLSLRHFIPVIFLMSFLLPAVLGVIFTFSPFFYASLIILGIYSLVFIIRSFYLSATTKETRWFYLFLAFFMLHTSYGSGSVYGLFNTARMSLCSK